MHPDGRREWLQPDGRRVTTFPNGTTKEQLPSGASIVRFSNGDVKKSMPDGGHRILLPVACSRAPALPKLLLHQILLPVACPRAPALPKLHGGGMSPPFLVNLLIRMPFSCFYFFHASQEGTRGRRFFFDSCC
jgi:T-complex protein 10 C-terminus